MHRYLGYKIYQVGGLPLTPRSKYPVYCIRMCDSAILVNSGALGDEEYLLRNLLELAVDPKELKYLVLFTPSKEGAGLCRWLRELLRGLTVVSRREDARTFREGRGMEEFEPCPASLEVDDEPRALIKCDEGAVVAYYGVDSIVIITSEWIAALSKDVGKFLELSESILKKLEEFSIVGQVPRNIKAVCSLDKPVCVYP